ncbi:MAG: hypothetical protein U0Q10_05445 [Dermatophilaceae bacterium]
MIDISVFSKDIVSTARPGAIEPATSASAPRCASRDCGGCSPKQKLKPRPRFGGSYFGHAACPLGVEATLAPQPVVRTRGSLGPPR